MLNLEQQHAVEATEPKVLVLAGAGTGKTRVLSHRFAYLLNQGEAPGCILALTFTRRAAAEMAQRIIDISHTQDRDELWIGTVHSICYRILRESGGPLGYPADLTVYGTAESRFLIEQTLTALSLRKYTVKQVEDAIKNSTAVPDLKRIVTEYRRTLKISGGIDYHGLLAATVELLQTFPDTAARYRGQFHHILVDEVQDLSPGSWELLEAIGPDHLFFVGDDSQSIYSFMGASIDKFFELVEAGATVYRLEQNYRSPGPVVALANGILSKNLRRLPKTLRTDREGETPILMGFLDDTAEMKFISQEIKILVGREDGTPEDAPGKLDWRDIAVLCRTNAFVERVGDLLTQARIPVQAVGLVDPFSGPTGTMLADLLRVASAPGDGLSMRRLLSTLDIPPATMAKLVIGRYSRGQSLMEGVESLLSPQHAAWLLVALIREAAPLLDNAPAAVRFFIEGIRRIRVLGNLTSPVAVIPIIRAVDALAASGPLSVRDLTTFLATRQSIDLWQPETDAVAVLTIHSAKGLEWPVVFIPGWEEGVLPSGLAMKSVAELEEERRVAHVAVTRAQDRLVCTWVAERNEYSRVFRRNRSRLLDGFVPAAAEVAAPLGL